jgi:hypothetical protein
VIDSKTGQPKQSLTAFRVHRDSTETLENSQTFYLKAGGGTNSKVKPNIFTFTVVDHGTGSIAARRRAGKSGGGAGGAGGAGAGAGAGEGEEEGGLA